MGWMVGALWAQPARGAAAPRAHAAGVGRHASRSPSCSTSRPPKGWFPFDDTGLIWGGTQASTGNLVPGDVRAAAAGDRHRAGRSGGRRRRLVDRDVVATTPRSIAASSSSASSRSSERRESAWDVINRLRPQAQRHPRAARVHVPGAGRAHRRALVRLVLPVHALDAGLSGAGRGGRRIVYERLQKVPELVDVSTDRAAGRAAGQRRRRPGRGVAARRAHPGHPERAQQRVRAAADCRRSTPSATSTA